MEEITVHELKEKLEKNKEVFILDVREPFEYKISNINGNLIPLKQLENRVQEIEDKKHKEVVVMCRSGGRSAQATKFLEKEGFKNVKNLKGGINEWAKKIDESLPTY